MKTVGTTHDGILCALTEQELKIIMFGKTEGLTAIEQQQYNQKHREEIKISDLYKKFVLFNQLKKNDSYNSARYQLQELLNGLETVDKFIEKQKEELNSDPTIKII
jgi:hypothetical protein